MRIKQLLEAFDMSRKEKGEVPFRKTTMADPRVQKVISEISAKTGVPAATIQGEMQDEIESYEELGTYSPLLYDTLIQNAAENAAFNNMDKSMKAGKLDVTVHKFDWRMFDKLKDYVQLDNKSFFPLQRPGDLTKLYRINRIFVPTNKPEFKKFNSVSTAAATHGGEFIFNVPFMQQLIDYATMVGEKPTSSKYESNGGDIPDNYCYIEFLIVHELLHFAYGDAASGKRFSQYSHTAHNFAMDFRSNYMMVKSGYTQLPLGLFSDDLNFDRIDSYEELIKIVDGEMKKLPRHLQAMLDKMDDHDKPPPKKGEEDKPPSPPWEPVPGEIVFNEVTGKFGIVEKNEAGKVTIKEVSREIVQKIYPELKVK